jgi:hypothetical protein
MVGRQVTHRNAEPALLRSLRLDAWTPAELGAVLGQLQIMAEFVVSLEHRWRPVWQLDFPISAELPPWPDDLVANIQACRAALEVPSGDRPIPATTELCATWREAGADDPMQAFVIVVMGAQWGEPALRSALREALWHQPDLYNGDARFCWSAGGPEGDRRRRVWQSIMALGSGAARLARLARATRLRWYDGLLTLREPPAARGTGPLVLASM